MVSGLAMNGMVPYLNAIAVFLTRRCLEQVLLDAALHRLPVRLVGNGGGLVYAPLGPTHLAVEDFALMRAVPGMTVVAPCDAAEMRRAVAASADHPGPLYLRIAKGGEPVVSRAESGFALGRAIAAAAGGDALLVTTGVMLQAALTARETLAAAGVGVAVLHAHTVKPLDAEAVLAAARTVRAVLTVEEHSLVGGLGSAVAELLAEAGLERPPRFRRLALPDAFPSQYGSQAEILAACGLDAAGIAAAVRRLLDGAAR
jgi:transketolase